MPKLWSHTIESHRRDVRDAILGATAALVTKHGLASVTMSQIAEETGIGRATLYKYFRDVQAILVAWHERQVARHLAKLVAAHDEPGDPVHRLEVMLGTYARIAHEEHATEVVALLHGGEHVARGYERFKILIRDLVTEGAKGGQLRDDVAPAELASFCIHALAAASSMPSLAAVRRLVSVTMSGLQRPKP